MILQYNIMRRIASDMGIRIIYHQCAHSDFKDMFTYWIYSALTPNLYGIGTVCKCRYNSPIQISVYSLVFE